MATNGFDDDRTRSLSSLVAGTEVSHYTIISKIGAGGMGEVYLAQDTELNRKVALKFLTSSLCQDESCRVRFKREAQAAAKLDHPNIVTVHEVSEYQCRPYFVMAHIEGQSLREYAENRELSIKQILKIGMQTCEGFQAAHESGVTHRDIKPSNILIDSYGRVRIVDFGLALVKGTGHLTKTGTTLGTIGYMSPEQVRGEEIDHRSDLFSLGVVLYELITGQPPFQKNSDVATLHAITHDSPETLLRLRKDASLELQTLVKKVLSKDLKTRHQSAKELLDDLARVAEGTPTLLSLPVFRALAYHQRRIWTILGIILAVSILSVMKPWQFFMQQDDQAVRGGNRIAIMYFNNLADPADSQKLGEIATNLLITDFSGSRYLQVVSSQRLYEILKLLGREGEKRIDPGIAKQIAEKAKAKWMLQGNILKVEPEIVLTAQLVEISSGNTVASQRIMGGPEEEIFSLIDKLTEGIMNDLFLPEEAFKGPDRAVADVTTHSMEAYRYYIEGLEFGFRHYFDDAKRALTRAVELDSTFAMAYYRLSGLGTNRRENAAKALAFSKNASHRERLTIEGFHAYLSGDLQTAIEKGKEIVKRYPDDKEAYHNLGYMYDYGLHQKDSAIWHYTKAIEIDSFYEAAYNQLAYCYSDIGEFDRSIWAINKYIEFAPDQANPYDTRGELYVRSGNLDGAIESFRKALKIKPDFLPSASKLGNILVLEGMYVSADSVYRLYLSSPDALNRARGRHYLAKISLHQGRFREALQFLSLGIETDILELGDSWPLFQKKWLRAYIYAWFSHDYGMAITEYEKARMILDRFAPDNALWINRINGAIAEANAHNGNVDVADSLVGELAADADSSNPRVIADVRFYSAKVEFEKGNLDKAILYVEKNYETDSSAMYMRFLGECYLRVDRLGDAVAMFEKSLRRYDAYNLDWPEFHVETHYWLGRAYQESGWNDQAIDQYETFLGIWKNADEGLESVEDAKERLARLRSKI